MAPKKPKYTRATKKPGHAHQARQAKKETETPGLRVFETRDGYEGSVRDVYDRYANADAAFWLPVASASVRLSGNLPPEGSPRVVMAWPDPAAPEARVVSGWLQPSELEALQTAPEARTVVISAAVPSPSPDVRQFITAIGKEQEISGQWNGYWYAPEDDVPDAKPAWDSTGAVLPAAPTRTDQTVIRVLDLVYVGTTWRPLSSAAVLTYVS